MTICVKESAAMPQGIVPHCIAYAAVRLKVKTLACTFPLLVVIREGEHALLSLQGAWKWS